MALDRDTVLRAALELVDAEGVDSLSMRRLAGVFGVTPMAIYNHVSDRADLLDGVAELVAREIGRPSSRWGWRRRLRAVLHGTRAACLAHPAAIPLLQGARSLTPALLAPAETALEALEDAGLRPAAARTAWAALIGLTFGHVAYELAGHMRGPAAGRGTPEPDEFPRIAAMAAAPPFDWDRAFARALDALIDGLAP
jgi:AcrR family transcriptional regulator